VLPETISGKMIHYINKVLRQKSDLVWNILQKDIRKPINHPQKPFYVKNNLFLPSVSIFLDKTGFSGIPKSVNL
jgi:hypothetical protein